MELRKLRRKKVVTEESPYANKAFFFLCFWSDICFTKSAKVKCNSSSIVRLKWSHKCGQQKFFQLNINTIKLYVIYKKFGN